MKKLLTLSLGIIGLSFLTVCNGQYNDVLNFNLTNGGNPSGSMVHYNGIYYGMTYEGGVNSDGVIFAVDSNGNGYRDLHDFNGTAGKNPLGTLTLYKNKFYGMTYLGGAN